MQESRRARTREPTDLAAQPARVVDRKQSRAVALRDRSQKGCTGRTRARPLEQGGLDRENPHLEVRRTVLEVVVRSGGDEKRCAGRERVATPAEPELSVDGVYGFYQLVFGCGQLDFGCHVAWRLHIDMMVLHRPLASGRANIIVEGLRGMIAYVAKAPIPSWVPFATVRAPVAMRSSLGLEPFSLP